MSDATPAQLERPRLLLITRNLPPLRGGMERLNLHMVLELAKTASVSVVGPLGCRSVLPGFIEVREVPAKPLWRFLPAALWCALIAARRYRPEQVLAGSGLAAPFAWCAARLAGARMVVYVHGLDLIANHPLYRWFWRPFIRRTQLCVANSRNTANLAVAIGVPEANIRIVHPGVDLPSAQPGAGDFRTRFGVSDRPLLLSIGRLITRKGLLEFVGSALPQVVEAFPDVCLLVLGDETPDLLHGTSVGLGERIRQRAAQRGVSRNLQFIGVQDDATLASAYSAADVHIFPVRDVPGDVEGFGMVAVEAAAHGLPTVAFAVGGVPDAIDDGKSGDLVAPEDYAQMALRIIERLTHRNDERVRASARAFAQDFCWSNFGSQIRQALWPNRQGTQVAVASR